MANPSLALAIKKDGSARSARRCVAPPRAIQVIETALLPAVDF
jgi:hypothetical protein